MLFTLTLHQRFGAQGLFSAAVHPGVVNTDLFYRNMPGWAKRMIAPIARLGTLTGSLRSPAQGAETGLYLAQTEGLPGGLYWFDKQPRQSTPAMQNADLAEQLWQMSLAWCQL